MLRFFSRSAALLATVLTLALALGAVPSAAAGLGPEEVRELEELLLRLGFDPGKVDDKVDEDTRAAIRRYQDFAVLPVDGKPTKTLLVEVRAVSVNPADAKRRQLDFFRRWLSEG